MSWLFCSGRRAWLVWTVASIDSIVDWCECAGGSRRALLGLTVAAEVCGLWKL